MSVDVLITHETPPLRPSDRVEYALGLMMEMRVRHLPVVDREGGLAGIISEDDLLGSTGPDFLVESRLQAHPVHVAPSDHVFEVTRVIMNHGLTMVPVTGRDGRYVGLIKRHDLFERFAAMLGTQSSGAILALEEDKRDAALSRIVYLIEQNDVRVLSLATEEMPDDHIGITLKLNVRDATRVRHILEHNGYHVVAAFGEDEDSDSLMDRVQEFMRYLEV
ncbi:MAG: acetoin utilization protein [Bacteroidetes bacterium CG12_big_fil_rev_8_21_14_0_65_60_17]|nr:MAG: acetoin utilization protein [Bacteroidetes bacterium CG12_big_fil_rev_8_21_14_0_65_60_17]